MQKKGFTLIELLVVIAIIGLLATLSVISFSGATTKSRDTKRKQDLVLIQKALELYYNDNGAYPSTSGAWRGTGGCYGTWGTTGTNAYIPNLSPQYIGVVPTDPKPMLKTTWPCNTPNQACYLYSSNGTDYKLLAHCTVEGSMPQANEPFYDPTRPTWGIMVCNLNSPACAW